MLSEEYDELWLGHLGQRIHGATYATTPDFQYMGSKKEPAPLRSTQARSKTDINDSIGLPTDLVLWIKP